MLSCAARRDGWRHDSGEAEQRGERDHSRSCLPASQRPRFPAYYLLTMHVLFVCTGNTCRSPMAAGIFRSLAKAHPTLRNVVVESAGIGALPDHPASAAAVEVMKASGTSAATGRRRWGMRTSSAATSS